MQQDEIRGQLRAYRENKSRAAYLEAEAEELRRGIWAENRPEMQAVHAQTYEYMPHPSARSSPTENRALWAVDGGETANAGRWKAELEKLEVELWEVSRKVAMVDVWLGGLTEKQRKVITAHELDGLPWHKVAFESEKILGHYMTADGLRRIGREAIDKICRIAM